MKFFKMSYLIAIILCMVIIDCSLSRDSKTIGKWTGYLQVRDVDIAQTELTIEFFRNKTCGFLDGSSGKGMILSSGKWVILEDNRIKIDVT